MNENIPETIHNKFIDIFDIDTRFTLFKIFKHAIDGMYKSGKFPPNQMPQEVQSTLYLCIQSIITYHIDIKLINYINAFNSYTKYIFE